MAPPRKERRCDICGREFNKPDHLVRHKRSHNNERPYSCEVCRKTFGRQDVLARHTRKHAERKETAADYEPGGDDDDDDEAEEDSLDAASSSQHNVSSSIRDTAPTAADTSSSTLFASTSSLATPGLTAVSSFEPDGGPLPPPKAFHSTVFSLPGPMPASAPIGAEYFLPPTATSYTLDPVLGVLAGPSPPIANPPGFNGLSDAFWDDILAFDTSDRAGQPSTAATSVSVTDRPPQYLIDETLDRISHQWPTMVHGRFAPAASGRSWPATYARICAGVDVQPIRPPSAAFLQMSMGLYFRHFAPVHSFMHEPTFSPYEHTPLLTLAMCAIGARFIEHDEARDFTSSVFKRLATYLQYYWSDTTIDQLDLVRIAILLQYYSLSTGQEDFVASAAFMQGGIVAHARRLQLFSSDGPCNHHVPPIEVLQRATADELQSLWREWVLGEEARRIGAALYHIDVLLHGQLRIDVLPPSLVTATTHTNLTNGVDDLYAAGDAVSWAQSVMASPPIQQYLLIDVLRYLLAQNDPSSPSPFDTCAQFSLQNAFLALCGLYQHSRALALSLLPMTGSHSAWQQQRPVLGWLDRWRQRFAARAGPLVTEVDRWQFGELMMVWHAHCFKELFARDEFEVVSGRDGAAAAAKMRSKVASLLDTPTHRRALLHAGQALLCLGTPAPMVYVGFFCFHVGLKAAMLLTTFSDLESRSFYPFPLATPFEISGAVDWDIIGQAGLVDSLPTIDEHRVLDPAVRWILYGGPWTWRGLSAAETLQWAADRMLEKAPGQTMPFGTTMANVLRLRAETL